MLTLTITYSLLERQHSVFFYSVNHLHTPLQLPQNGQSLTKKPKFWRGTCNTNWFFFSCFLNFSVHGRHTLVGHAPEKKTIYQIFRKIFGKQIHKKRREFVWYLNRLPGPAAAQTADASEETEEDDEDQRREDVDVRRLQTALPCLDLVMRIHDNPII